jgi:hypothetical protein
MRIPRSRKGWHAINPTTDNTNCFKSWPGDREKRSANSHIDALEKKDMDILWVAVDDGSPIEIYP